MVDEAARFDDWVQNELSVLLGFPAGEELVKYVFLFLDVILLSIYKELRSRNRLPMFANLCNQVNNVAIKRVNVSLEVFGRVI